VTSDDALRIQLADAMHQEAVRAGAASPKVRRADWQTAIVTAVGGDGTVNVGVIVARCLDSYPAPAVGDQIFLTNSGAGNWVAVGRTSSADLGIGQFATAWKESSTARASTTSATDDPDLTIPVVANARYVVEGWIVTTNANQVGDLRCTISGPAGSTGRWNLIMPSTTLGTDPVEVRVSTNSLGSTLSYGQPSTGQYGGQLGGMIATGGTPGGCAFAWAQHTSNATPTIVEPNSWLRLTRVA